MVHQPSAGFQGQVTDIEIHANEVLSLKKRLNEIYSKHTGKNGPNKGCFRKRQFTTPDNAKDFGLIDQVVEKEFSFYHISFSIILNLKWVPTYNKVLLLICYKFYECTKTFCTVLSVQSQHEVRKLIAGPTVFICDECRTLHGYY